MFKAKNLFACYRRGSLLSTAIFVYAATAPVNGFFGGSLYSRQGGTIYANSWYMYFKIQASFTLELWYHFSYCLSLCRGFLPRRRCTTVCEIVLFVFDVCRLIFLGKQWIRQMAAAAFLVPALVCGVAFFINFIAIYYHASRAIQFGSMVNTSIKKL